MQSFNETLKFQSNPVLEEESLRIQKRLGTDSSCSDFKLDMNVQSHVFTPNRDSIRNINELDENQHAIINANQKRPLSSPCPENLSKRSKRPSSVLGIERSDEQIDSSFFQSIISSDTNADINVESITNAPTSNITQSTESPIDKHSSEPHQVEANDGEDSIASLLLDHSTFLDEIKNYAAEFCPIDCLVLIERCRPFNNDTIFMNYFRDQYLEPILSFMNGGPPLNADFGRDAYTSLYTMQSYSWHKSFPCDILVEDTPQIYQILKKAKSMMFEDRHVTGNSGDCVKGVQLLRSALAEFMRLEKLRRGLCKKVIRHLLILTCSPISLPNKIESNDDGADLNPIMALKAKSVNLSIFSPLELGCYSQLYRTVNNDQDPEPIYDRQWKTVLLSPPLFSAKPIGLQASQSHEEYIVKVRTANPRFNSNYTNGTSSSSTLKGIESNSLAHPSPQSAPLPLHQQSPLLIPQCGHLSAGPAPFNSNTNVPLINSNGNFSIPSSGAYSQTNAQQNVPSPINSQPKSNQNMNWMSPSGNFTGTRDNMPSPSPGSVNSSANNSFSNSTTIPGQRSGPSSVHAPPASPNAAAIRKTTGPGSNGPSSNQAISCENPLSWGALAPGSVSSGGPLGSVGHANSPLPSQDQRTSYHQQSNVDPLIPSAASTPQHYQITQASPRSNSLSAKTPQSPYMMSQQPCSVGGGPNSIEYQSSPHNNRQQPPSPYTVGGGGLVQSNNNFGNPYMDRNQVPQPPVYQPPTNRAVLPQSPYPNHSNMPIQQNPPGYHQIVRNQNSPYQHSSQTMSEQSITGNIPSPTTKSINNQQRIVSNRPMTSELNKNEQQTQLEQILIKQQRPNASNIAQSQNLINASSQPPTSHLMKRNNPSPQSIYQQQQQQLMRPQWDHQQMSTIASQRSVGDQMMTSNNISVKMPQSGQGNWPITQQQTNQIGQHQQIYQQSQQQIMMTQQQKAPHTMINSQYSSQQMSNQNSNQHLRPQMTNQMQAMNSNSQRMTKQQTIPQQIIYNNEKVSTAPPPPAYPQQHPIGIQNQSMPPQQIYHQQNRPTQGQFQTGMVQHGQMANHPRINDQKMMQSQFIDQQNSAITQGNFVPGSNQQFVNRTQTNPMFSQNTRLNASHQVYMGQQMVPRQQHPISQQQMQFMQGDYQQHQQQMYPQQGRMQQY